MYFYAFTDKLHAKSVKMAVACIFETDYSVAEVKYSATEPDKPKLAINGLN
jgi:hypothetical protein